MWLWAVASAFGATWTVDPKGGGDFTSIGDAVAAAADGDEIDLVAGTFSEDVDVSGRTLALVGAGSSSTVLAPTSTGFTASGATLTISGLTIRGGDRGIDGDGDLVLDDVVLTGQGTGFEDGAAVRWTSGTLAWTSGKAEYADAGNGTVYLEDTVATLDSVDLDYSSALAGGALYGVNATIALDGCGLLRNKATGDGGAVWLDGGSLTMTSSAILANVASDDGGAIYATDADVELDDTTVDQCTATTGDGGAMSLSGGSLTVSGGSWTDDLDASGSPLLAYDTDVRFSDHTLTKSSGSKVVAETYRGSVSLTSVTWSGVGLEQRYGTFTGDDVSVSTLVVGSGDGASLTGAVDAEKIELGNEPVSIYDADVTTTSGGGTAFYSCATVDVRSSAFHGTAMSIEPSEYDPSGMVASFDGVTFDASTLVLDYDEGSVTLDIVDGSFDASSVTFSSRYGTVSADLEDVSFDGASGTSPALSIGSGDIELRSLRVANTSYGGVAVSGGTVSVHDGWFGDNKGSTTYGDRPLSVTGGDVTVTSSVFDANSSGAVYTSGGSLLVDGCVFQDNQATHGAAIYVDGGFPDVRDVTAVGNSATAAGRSGVFEVASGYIALVNTIVADSPKGYGLYTSSSTAGSWSTIEYDDFWNNTDGDAGGSFTSPVGTNGNIGADPLFVSWTADSSMAGDDLHLQAGSPCIDAGTPAWLDADGTWSDIGAYGGEFGSDVDYDGDGVLPSEGDCDDSRDTVYEGAPEIPYDGLDNDCSGDGDLTDVDGDGHDATVVGGDDCDDDDATIHPGADEIVDDGIDQDCDGKDATSGDTDTDGGDTGTSGDDTDTSGDDTDTTGDDTDTSGDDTDTTGDDTDASGDDTDSLGEGKGGLHIGKCGCDSAPGLPQGAMLMALAAVIVGRRRR